jgi:hypothetical protein
MRNYFLLTLIFVSYGSYLFPVDITLITPFKLNPITGINGDDYEASSKFVQRMIFSPLVFPLQDPYLQDDYSVALCLSLIEEKIQYRAANGSWMEYDMAAPISGRTPSSTFFKVKLRRNLNFYKTDNRAKRISLYSPLSAEDVVFSYRLSRITIDRAYQTYLKNTAGSPLGLNTLLYAKIKSFDDIYCTDNYEIVFEMDSQKSCIEFKNLLAYVPVLSIKQILGANSQNPNDTINQLLRSSIKLSQLMESNRLSDTRYNSFDFNFLLKQRELIDEFFNHPVGFGQYLVEKTTPYAGADMKEDRFKGITLVRNPYWCVFGDTVKRIGEETFNHTDYAKKKDRINVTLTNITDSKQRIKELQNNTNQVLYNVPLSAAIFPRNEVTENRIISASLSKRKMQISHSLYGIFFGPSIVDPSRPILPEARRFFGQFADRVRIENIIRFIGTDTVQELFNAAITDNTSITSDMELQRLYIPFYSGNSNTVSGGESPITTYYRDKERRDTQVQEYLNQLDGKTIKEYYTMLSGSRREDFYLSYVGGKNFPDDFNELLKKDLNNSFIRNNILVNNEIHMEIVYKTGDDIGRSIALHYQQVFQIFFGRQDSIKFDNNWIQSREIQNYQRWEKLAKDNAKKRVISLLVKGWNYKFDLLDELRDQFVDGQSLARIKDQYDNLINRGAIGLEAAENYKNIAAEFVDNNVIIPLVGVQNYVIYGKGYFPAFDKNEDIEILLLPYYWSED